MCVHAHSLLLVSKPWGEEFHHLLAESLKPPNPSPVEIKPLWIVHYRSLCFALKFFFPSEEHLFHKPFVLMILGGSRCVCGCAGWQLGRERRVSVPAGAPRVTYCPLCLSKGGYMLFPTSMLSKSVTVLGKGMVDFTWLLYLLPCWQLGFVSWVGSKHGLLHSKKK